MDSLIKLSIVSLCLTMALTHTNAQNSPEDFLAPHNAARAAVGVPPLVWDDNLAAWAKNYTNTLTEKCEMVHSQGPYGENLAGGSFKQSGGEFKLDANTAVTMWVGEKSIFDQGGGSGACFESGSCGHYTQVVWRKSERVGCAVVNCPMGGIIISCNYDPPGNMIGELPY